MTALWPWLAVAGLGALHGLNPASCWMLASCSSRSGPRALLAMGLGHAAAMAAVAGCYAQGLAPDWPLLRGACVALLALMFILRLLRGSGSLALWSALLGTAHGTGMMLVPALVPLCMDGNPAREITASGSLAMALAATGLHLAAMLASTAVLAAGMRRTAAWIRP